MWMPAIHHPSGWLDMQYLADDYQCALSLERMGCCVTKMEYANSNGVGKNIVSFFYVFNEFIYCMVKFITWIHIINEFIENN